MIPVSDPSSGFMDMLSGPSWVGGPSGMSMTRDGASPGGRLPSGAAAPPLPLLRAGVMPTHLQRQLAGSATGSPEQEQMLADLEDAVMRIPSEELLHAATQVRVSTVLAGEMVWMRTKMKGTDECFCLTSTVPA